MSDRNGVYQNLVDEYEAEGFTYEEASKLAILNLKYKYDHDVEEDDSSCFIFYWIFLRRVQRFFNYHCSFVYFF